MSDYEMQHRLYDNSFRVTYEYPAPLGRLKLLDGETGEPVEDYFHGDRAEARAFMAAESAVHTLRVMDTWL